MSTPPDPDESGLRHPGAARSLALDVAIGEAAHDLRAPVASVVGAARLLARDDLPRESVERLLEIVDRGERVAEWIIADLVDRAQRATTRAAPSRTRQRLRPIIERAADIVAAARSVDVVVEADADLEAWTDDVALFRVVQNLVDNAARHSGASTVHVGADADHGVVRVVVSDEGRGLPVAVRRLLEHPDDASARAASGDLGLGLLTTLQLVRELGGTIALGHPSGGAQIEISLPQREGRADRPPRRGG